MSLTVLAALSSPVVLTAAALGTLDGFGRLMVNIPRVLELQYAYANRLMERGSLDRISTDPVSFLRSKVLENAEYRSNVLRLFVKYDTDGDGMLTKDQLSLALAEFPSLGRTLGADSIEGVWDALDRCVCACVRACAYACVRAGVRKVMQSVKTYKNCMFVCTPTRMVCWYEYKHE